MMFPVKENEKLALFTPLNTDVSVQFKVLTERVKIKDEILQSVALALPSLIPTLILKIPKSVNPP
jgi:hypothetical protein